MDISLGYSPCPNDTFIFGALANNMIDPGNFTFAVRLEDVETLNRLCAEKRLDVTKISIAALAHCLKDYALLSSGGALGRGCGPLIVARPGAKIETMAESAVAVPGTRTTAHLLLSLFLGKCPRVLPMPFDAIMPAVQKGDCLYGVIIHEGRFTFQNYGLRCLLDLGKWWEQKTSLPIPLGGIAIRRELAETAAGKISSLIRRSLTFAWENPSRLQEYIRAHAQEMKAGVIREHIRLYVNDFSRDLGTEGRQAIRELLRAGSEIGLLPSLDEDIFAEPEP
jgi:1,4-dihydroxy-6-naphthoate synthase